MNRDWAGVLRLDRLDGLFQEEDVFQRPDLWGWPRSEALLETALHHARTTPGYRALVEAQGGAAALREQAGSWTQIPLVSARSFKSEPQLLVSEGTSQHRIFRSSGTQGVTSRVARDEQSLSRLLGSVDLGTREILELPDYVEVINLGPAVENADDVWFSYVMALVELIHPSRAFSSADVFQIEEAAQALAEPSGETKVVVGPPPLVSDLVRYMTEQRITAQCVDAVITGGGWKRRSNEALDHSQLVSALKKVPGCENVKLRDTYNCVEMNTVLFQCESERFHVPPWLALGVLDPRCESVSEAGEGMLCIYDATATSYPAFVLTDDLGTVYPAGTCACGRVGETMCFQRRVTRSEGRGCARKLDEALGSRSS